MQRKNDMLYNSYSDFLKNKYGGKVYKIPVNLPITCPNRDGNCGYGGCIFCGESGAAFEKIPSTESIRTQIDENIFFTRNRYKADKFIIYLQNYTNTYMPLNTFKDVLGECVAENVCALYISTRPDCINDEYMNVVKEFSELHGYDVCIELGLQSINHKTLKLINRGHTLAEFIDAVLTIKRFGFDICAHVILNLPWDDMDDVIECAKILSSLKVDQVKIHSLYIPCNTKLAVMYENNEFEMGTFYDYVDRVIHFLRYLSPEIVIQRLIGRAQAKTTLFNNYSTSWWKIKDNIINEMQIKGIKQGDMCDYLNGKALKKFKK